MTVWQENLVTQNAGSGPQSEFWPHHICERANVPIVNQNMVAFAGGPAADGVVAPNAYALRMPMFFAPIGRMCTAPITRMCKGVR